MTVCRTSRQRSKAQKKIENFLNYRLEFSQTYNIFQPSQVTVKRNAVFYFGFFAPFLFRLFSAPFFREPKRIKKGAKKPQ